MSKPLDLEAFVTHIEAATRQAGYEIDRREGADLYVLVHGQSLRCNLAQIFDAYKSAPVRLDDIVQAHLNALRQVPPPSPPPTEEQAAESLLPMLHQAQWIEQDDENDVPPPAYQPFIAGLIITYVLDFPEYRVYLGGDTLQQFTGQPGVTLEAVHEYALANLRKRTTSQDYQTHGLHDKTMVVCETHDGYAATRVLLPDLMEKWAERIPGRMLIGIPNRDFLIAIGDRNRKHVKAIARQVRRDAKKREHPLCGDLLVWEEGQIKEYHRKH